MNSFFDADAGDSRDDHLLHRWSDRRGSRAYTMCPNDMCMSQEDTEGEESIAQRCALFACSVVVCRGDDTV